MSESEEYLKAAREQIREAVKRLGLQISFCSCGSDKIKVHHADGQGRSVKRYGYWLGCSSCDYLSPPGQTIVKAIAFWNLRAAD